MSAVTAVSAWRAVALDGRRAMTLREGVRRSLSAGSVSLLSGA